MMALNRRQFVGTTAALLSAASHDGLAPATETAKQTSLEGLPRIPYGAVYFRKSNPPQKDWERDYQQAAADGMNCFRHWFLWSAIEVAPGDTIGTITTGSLIWRRSMASRRSPPTSCARPRNGRSRSIRTPGSRTRTGPARRRTTRSPVPWADGRGSVWTTKRSASTRNSFCGRWSNVIATIPPWAATM